MRKSFFSSLGFQEVEEQSYSARVEMVEGSATMFADDEVEAMTKCVLRSCTYKEKTTMKLLIHITIGGKNHEAWIKLDGKSYKLYEDSANTGIDPTKVVVYQLHDFEEEWGDAEKNHNWWVCRIKKGAEDPSYGDHSAASDDDLFDEAEENLKKDLKKTKKVKKSTKKVDDLPF